MSISMKCPHCEAGETFPDTDAGSTVNCSACGGAINLPAKARPVAAAVVAQAKPIAAVPVVAAAVVAAAPVVLKAKSKPAVDLDEDEEPKPPKKSKPALDLDEDDDRPRKKSKPAVDLDEDDEKPRKKSKPAVDLDEDDEKPRKKSKPALELDEGDDEAPKKKSRKRDDDGDDDDRPRKKKPAKKKGGAMKILLILGGIGFVMLAGCSGIGYYLYYKADKAVTSIQSQWSIPTDPATKPNEVKPGPNLKENAAKVNIGDTYKVVLKEKMGDTRECRMQDLEEWKKVYTGADKGVFDFVLDYYAPWVDKGCAKLYHNTVLKYRVIVIYGDKTFGNLENPAMEVKGLLSLDESGAKTVYSEPVMLTRFPTTDTDGARLGLKRWVGLKEDSGTGVAPSLALKEKAVNISRGDTLLQVETRMGSGSPYTLDALKADLAKYKKPAGEGADVVPSTCDRFAPWIDKNCAAFWRENDFCAVVVFALPLNKPGVARRKVVKGVFWFDEKDGVGEFKEHVQIGSDYAGDLDAKALNLKPYKDLKEVGGGTEPPKPPALVKISAEDLAAEAIKDRAAAFKKYDGSTLEISGEVASKSVSGAVLFLKGTTDDVSGKSYLVSVSILLMVDRETAKKCQVGDKITVKGIMPMNQTATGPIVIRDGAFK